MDIGLRNSYGIVQNRRGWPAANDGGAGRVLPAPRELDHVLRLREQLALVNGHFHVNGLHYVQPPGGLEVVPGHIAPVELLR